jgi:hypothetical protein
LLEARIVALDCVREGNPAFLWNAQPMKNAKAGTFFVRQGG